MRLLKGKDISYLRYYFNDSYEVDDARGESNWTPAFLTNSKNIGDMTCVSTYLHC